jgi:phage gp29-like protein
MPDNNPIKRAVSNWLEWLVPRQSTKGWYNYRASEPTFIANLLDVDRLRQVISSAETGNVRDLFGLYRDVIMSDPHVQAEFGKRKLAVLGDTLSIQPPNKKDPNDVKACDFIKDTISEFSGVTLSCGHLLDGHLYPLALLEKVFKPSSRPGIRYDLMALNPVQANDLDYTTGWLKLRKLDQHGGYLLGDLEEPDPNRYIIHVGHLLSAAPFWGGPMRSILFWWLLRSMDRDWWSRFLERYGSPFIVGKYDQSDDASRMILTQAFNAATKIFGLVISSETEVELIQAAAGQTGEAFEKFHDRCNDEISKLIVGQTASSNMKSTGMGSGVSKQHEGVRQDIRQFDSKVLGETLRDQLFKPLLWMNGFTGKAPHAFWGGMSPEDQTALGTLLGNLGQAGIEPTDDGLETLGEQLGFPLQRKAVPTPPMPPGGGPPSGFTSPELQPLAAREPQLADQTHAAVDRVAQAGAADLSRAFRGSLAPVRQIILESSSAADCEERLRNFYADWSPSKVSSLVSDALTAFAANGCSVNVAATD